jgi:hydroxyacylglutathione hydrolase
VSSPSALAVDRYELGPMGTNCYVVRATRGAAEAVVIDPSGDPAQLRLELARMGATVAAILVTHGHWDHLLGVADLAEGTGAPVYMAEDERALLENLTDLVPPGVVARGYTADTFLQGGETLELAGIELETVKVPGHSPAHLAYHADGCLFSGDVLFARSVGRTDLPGGDWAVLSRSIESLLDRYPDEQRVFPGHMGLTTLGRERATNPFLQELA